MYTKAIKVLALLTSIIVFFVTTISNSTLSMEPHNFQDFMIEVDDRVRDLDWHPTEAIIAAAVGYEILIVDTQDGEIKNIILPENFVDIKSIHWKPDGSKISVLGNLIRNRVYADTIVIIDANSLVELYRLDTNIYTSFNWNPTKDQFIFTTSNSDTERSFLHIAEDKNGDTLQTYDIAQVLGYPSVSNPISVSAVWTSPNTLITASYRGYISHITSDGNIEQESFFGLTPDEYLGLGSGAGVTHALSWSPQTSRLAVAGFRNPDSYMIRIWDIPTSTLEASLENNVGIIYDLLWSPDGRYLAGGGTNNVVHIWSAGEFLELLTLEHNDVVTSIAWSPDSHIIATGSYDQTIRFSQVNSK